MVTVEHAQLTHIPTIRRNGDHRDAKRRAAMYHKRADELAEVALRLRDDDDRRHYLNLSKGLRAHRSAAREQAVKMASAYLERNRKRK